MLNLDLQKLNGFNSTTQLNVGRALERYRTINAKPNKTAAELAELERHMKTLAPFRLDIDHPATSVDARREQKATQVADLNRGVVINAQKVEAANLSGAQRLTLHRQSAALAKLIVRDPATLSAQDKSQLDKLKESVRPFVGFSDRPGTDNDFKVAA